VGDELRFTQVIINLLGNAIKFTPENGFISLDIQNLGQENGECIIEVRVTDSGIGINPEHQKKLFLPFEQGDGSITREYGGTGLGLAISKYIVGLMGGKIWAESIHGKGSMFAFTARMRIGDDNVCECNGALIHSTLRKDVLDLRVLIVSSSKDTREYMFHVLEAFSIKCAAVNGEPEAIDAVSESLRKNEPFDIVFIDNIIPDKSAVKAASRIMEILPESVVFIILPKTDWPGIEMEARASGISQYLPKPFTPSMLIEAIHRVTGYSYKKLDPKSVAEINDLSRFTLLLVEDVEINREIVYAVLEDTRINIETAENGIKAVEMFAAAPDKYNIILMDVQMPVMDGIEATRRIRAMGTNQARDITIVAMTANVFKEDVDKCKAAGMNDHIAKPIDTNLLLEKLSDYLFVNEYKYQK
jgi:CheY-like chemotaxis protein